MSTLASLQDQFQAYLLSSAEFIHHEIISTETVSAKERLDIYGSGYQYRLIDALAAAYPVVADYVGSLEFEALMREYIKQYPSPFRSIRWFGDQLADFLFVHPDYQDALYLSELARLEWETTLAFDAPDSEVMSLEGMQVIPPEAWPTMRLKPHPSVRCLSFSWNVVDIWQAITQDEEPPAPIENETPSKWLLWRKELENQFCSLEDSEAWAIDAMFQGMTFGEMCEGLCQWIDEQDAPLYAASLLKSWILEGVIEKVIYTSNF